jgi:hemoglobin
MSRPYVPPVDPARIAAPSREIYGVMGEANIARMIEDFYRELEQSSVRGLFPEDMAAAAQKSAAFFVGLLGGPPLYHQRYGNPMMRARHLRFAITPRARAEWLRCFQRVLARLLRVPRRAPAGFRAFLQQFSLWMVNTESGDGGDSPRALRPGGGQEPALGFDVRPAGSIMRPGRASGAREAKRRRGSLLHASGVLDLRSSLEVAGVARRQSGAELIPSSSINVVTRAADCRLVDRRPAYGQARLTGKPWSRHLGRRRRPVRS